MHNDAHNLMEIRINTLPRVLASLLALSLPLLGACNPSSTAPSPQPAVNQSSSSNSTASTPDTMIGRAMDKGMRQAREELEKGNIDISGGVHFHGRINGRQIGHDDDNDSHLPKAEITPHGDLLIEDKPVTITPTQRGLLLAYRHQIIGIAGAGMAMGTKGVDLAGQAVTQALGSVCGGESDKVKRDLEAQGKKLEVEAKLLCDRMPPMLATQQKLAASLPAFKPYARMTREDIDDCKDSKGAAVTSH